MGWVAGRQRETVSGSRGASNPAGPAPPSSPALGDPSRHREAPESAAVPDSFGALDKDLVSIILSTERRQTHPEGCGQEALGWRVSASAAPHTECCIMALAGNTA